MNTSAYYLGLDIGTTAVKAALFDRDGVPVGVGLSEYTLETPRPDIVELPAEQYWFSACDAIDQAIKRSGVKPAGVSSLAITGQVETLICVDSHGVPLRKAIVWLDNRAVDEARELEAEFGRDSLFRMSGQTEMLPCWPAPKILWLERHEPDVFHHTDKFLMVEDYLLHRFCGTFATCRGLLPSTLYYDIRTGEYDPPMLKRLGIDVDRLPLLRQPGEVLAITRENGSVLPPGIPVGGAPLDHVCGCLGAGCTRPGIVSETTGCTLALCAPFDRIVYDEERRIGTYLGFTPDSFVLLPWAPTAGMLLRYFRDEFSGGMSYADLDREAACVAPGSDGLLILPHCAGAVSPVCNPAARGVAYGVTLAHKRPHWARAIMESVAYLLKDNALALEATGGHPVSELRALGGASHSPLWTRIMADVLNIPITLTECEEVTALGAAILGACAAGDFPSPAAAADRMVRIRSRIEPGSDCAAYPPLFHQYQTLNHLLMPTFGGLL